MTTIASKLRALGVAVLLLLIVPVLGLAQEYSWYFDDGPDGMYAWEDVSIGPFWEWMFPTAIEVGDITCTIADLLTNEYHQPYYACSPIEDATYLDKHFWAEIYLDNSWAGTETVDVYFGTGTPGVAASFVSIVGPVTGTVTTSGTWDCGVMYSFDFGTIPSITLASNSLIVMIDHPVDNGGTTHVFWDGECCPSVLHMEPSTAVDEESWSRVKSLYR